MTDSYWSFADAAVGLVTALRLRTYIIDNQIQVVAGWPGDTINQRSIYLEEGRGDDTVAGMRQGPVKNNESYLMHWMCDSFHEGGDSEAALVGLTPLVGELMAEIAEKKLITTPDNKVLAARVSQWRFRPYALREGRGAACRVTVAVTGRR